MTENCILLIDDDAGDVFLVQRAFTKAGLGSNLIVVNDGEEAIRYFNGDGKYADREQFPIPVLVLLDLKMPRKSGFEVLAWLRSRPTLRRLPVVVLTSSNQLPDINKAYDVGANSYLVKTANPQAMQELTHIIDLYWTKLNQRPQIHTESWRDE